MLVLQGVDDRLSKREAEGPVQPSPARESFGASRGGSDAFDSVAFFAGVNSSGAWSSRERANFGCPSPPFSGV
jgi:hypothetical protein